MEGTPERWAEGPAVLTSVWRYRWIVLAATVLFGVAGLLLSSQQTPVYETSARLYLSDPGSSDIFGRGGGMSFDRYIPQQTERITSTPVLTAAAAELEEVSPSGLRRQLDVRGNPDLGTLTITVQDGDPERAAGVANAVATAYQDNVREARLDRAERAAAELETAETDIQEQIEQLTGGTEATEPDPATQGQLGVLAQRLVEIDTLSQQLRVDARLFGSGVEFVEAAQPPTEPVSPTPRRTAAATGLLGAVLASAVAYQLAGRSRRVVSRDDPATALGVPLLGVLPTYDAGRASSLRERAALDPRTAEAYRFVQSSLARLLRETGARSVLVTSPSPGAGKTETALQLAITAGDRGSRVLLVDADVRLRGLSRFLRADRTPGLLDLERPDAPSPVDLVTFYPLSDGHDLAVVTAGVLHGDGPPQVQERWFGHALPEFVDCFDLTILDSPPLLSVADTATLAAYSDAVVLVVREGSDLDDLTRVHQRMRFFGQRLVGYVYLCADALDDSSFDYGLVRAKGAATSPSRPAAEGRSTGRPAGATPTGSRSAAAAPAGSTVRRVSNPAPTPSGTDRRAGPASVPPTSPAAPRTATPSRAPEVARGDVAPPRPRATEQHPPAHTDVAQQFGVGRWASKDRDRRPRDGDAGP